MKPKSPHKLCEKTGKVCFTSIEEANRAINRIQRNSDRDKVPVRHYVCGYCGDYHLTSVANKHTYDGNNVDNYNNLNNRNPVSDKFIDAIYGQIQRKIKIGQNYDQFIKILRQKNHGVIPEKIQQLISIKESYGSGFSMSGGMTRGFSGRGGGFGGGSNLGGPNMMYTYEIKPLNTLLTQKQPQVDDKEEIHLGLSIRGKKLHGESKKWYTGHLMKIVKTDNGAIKYYEILDQTGTKIKLNPTSVTIVSNSPIMNDLKIKDVYGDEPLEQKSKLKEGLVPESLDQLYEIKKEA